MSPTLPDNRNAEQPSAPGTKQTRRWLQFRLSFVLCVVTLLAIGLSGANFVRADGFEVLGLPEYIQEWLPTALFLFPSLATAAVLFLGRASHPLLSN
jgi:hypothetical protein